MLAFVSRHFLLPVFVVHAGFDPIQEATCSRTLQAPSLCIAPRKLEETILPRKRENTLRNRRGLEFRQDFIF